MADSIILLIGGFCIGFMVRTFMDTSNPLCPKHHAPIYWDSDYKKERCSITHQPVKYEYGDKE